MKTVLARENIMWGLLSHRAGGGADAVSLVAGRERAALHEDFLTELNPGHGTMESDLGGTAGWP
ncbi:MAG: hypothetical protein Q4G45_06680 [Actinomycetia bacterium]|nr:hypothetical protein [Actinomycetes bacterium]